MGGGERGVGVGGKDGGREGGMGGVERVRGTKEGGRVGEGGGGEMWGGWVGVGKEEIRGRGRGGEWRGAGGVKGGVGEKGGRGGRVY